MAATNFTPISLYYSTTASAVPVNTNLVAGELALNTLDEKLYFKNSAGTVKLLASNSSSSGTVSSVAASVPAFLSIAGSPITTSGTLAITYSGTALPIANGGTGLTTTPANGALDIGNGTGFTRTTLTAGTGISITNTSGAISIASTASVSAATPTALGTVYGRQTTSGGTPYLTAYGYNAGVNSTGVRNTAMGVSALQANTTGNWNVAIGDNALLSNVSGVNNTAVGAWALRLNTTDSNSAFGTAALGSVTSGTEQVAVGYAALSTLTTGTRNTAVGSGAMQLATTANYNVAVGINSGYQITTGSSNTALGSYALNANTTADGNTAVGYNALTANTTGATNTAVGYLALDASTTASENDAFGGSALTNLTTGTGNVAIGSSAMLTLTTGSQNVAVGRAALYFSTGSDNTAMGRSAGFGVTTGTQNTLLGRSAGYVGGGSDLTTGSNNILIGYNSVPSSASVSNENTFGNSSTTSNRFWGDMQMGGSSAGSSGQVLTSAGAGVSPTWVAPSAGALVYISSVTASAATTVDLENAFTAYEQYVIIGSEIVLAGGGIFAFRFKIGGSYITSSTYSYWYSQGTSTGAGTPYVDIAANSSSQIYAQTQGTAGASNLYAKIGVKSGFKTMVNFDTNSDLNGMTYSNGAGTNNSTGALQGIRIFGGTYTGTFRLYGVVNS